MLTLLSSLKRLVASLSLAFETGFESLFKKTFSMIFKDLFILFIETGGAMRRFLEQER
jgi:hypothetical protein